MGLTAFRSPYAKGHLRPPAPVQHRLVTAPFRGVPTELFQKEFDARPFTLIPKIPKPGIVCGTTSALTLTASNQPVDTRQIKIRDWSEKRFGRDETYRCGRATEVINSPRKSRTLDRNAHPHVGRPRQRPSHACNALGSFGEHLVNVMWCSAHDVEDKLNVFVWNVFVEQVRHAVHKDHSRPLPVQWDIESFGSEGKCEPARKRFREAHRDPFRVAAIAAG